MVMAQAMRPALLRDEVLRLQFIATLRGQFSRF